MEVKIFTDGSSRGNPGPGGFGVLLLAGKYKKEISKGFRFTTNNRMELMAIIAGLQVLKRTDLPIYIYSDSRYVVNTIEKGWLKNWLKTGFKGKKNSDLWKVYHELAKPFNIKMIWVKGHADNPYNNHCDMLATKAADGTNLEIDEGYELENGRN